MYLIGFMSFRNAQMNASRVATREDVPRQYVAAAIVGQNQIQNQNQAIVGLEFKYSSFQPLLSKLHRGSESGLRFMISNCVKDEDNGRFRVAIVFESILHPRSIAKE
jgi:hypothetical protein